MPTLFSSQPGGITAQPRAATYTDNQQPSVITVVSEPALNVYDPRIGCVGDGRDETAKLQKAVDWSEQAAANNNARGGYGVVMPYGIFGVTAPVKSRIGNLTLEGGGAGYPTGSVPNAGQPVLGGTIIRPLATFVGDYVLRVGQDVGSPDHSLGGITLRDFSIDSSFLDPANIVGGLLFQAQRSRIEDVIVARSTGKGVYVQSPDGTSGYPENAYDNVLRNVIITQASANPTNQGHGLHFSPGATDNMIEGVIVRGQAAGFNGIYNEGAGNQFMGGLVELCNDVAVYCAESRAVKLGGGLRVMDAAGGIFMGNESATEGGDWSIVGVTLRSCSRLGDGLTDGIVVNPAFSPMRGGVISGVDFSSVGRNDPGYRMRHLINIASANAIGVRIGSLGMGWVTPATGLYTGMMVRNLGAGTIVDPLVLAQANVAIPHTGDTAETVLATVTIPAGIMGLNGRLEIDTVFSRNAGGTATVTSGVRLGGIGGTRYLNVGLTTANLSGRLRNEIINRNAQNSQIGAASNGTSGVGSGAPVTSAIDTSADTTLVITGQCTNAGDTIALESYTVRLILS